MVTRGDANDAPERWTVPTGGEIGRVSYHVPKVGYVRAFISTPRRSPRRARGRAAAGALPARRHLAAATARAKPEAVVSMNVTAENACAPGESHRQAADARPCRLRRAWRVVLLGVSAGSGTRAAVTGTTSNAGNRVEAGSVKLISDNDGGSAMLSLVAPLPGATRHQLHQGHLRRAPCASSVQLYGTTTGGPRPVPRPEGHARDLQPHRRRRSTPAPTSRPTAPSTSRQGNGVIYNGTLQGFPDDYAAGLVDPTSATPETWTTARRTSTGSR